MRNYPCRECERPLRAYVLVALDEDDVVYLGRDGGAVEHWEVIVRCDCGTDNKFDGDGPP